MQNPQNLFFQKHTLLYKKTLTIQSNLGENVMNLVDLPRRGYVTCPTPLEKAENFTKALGGKVNIYMKRDDLLPGTSGGNKTRKLDFSIADAIEKGADTLITCGAVQSNHCRLTLAWAVKEGMDCHLILEERVAGSYNKDASGNNFLFRLLGAKSISTVAGGSNMMAEMEKLAEELRKQGKKPYIIPGGASDAIGATGYVVCSQELLAQAYSQNLHIDYIVVPSGSAGTHAGMLTGINAIAPHIPIIGIDTSRPADAQAENVYNLVKKTVERVRAPEVPKEKVLCNGDYYQPGYSLPNEAMFEAIKLLAQTESILLDPVYTGKVMAGMIALVRTGYFREGSNVVFLHTGGSPALYAYTDSFYQNAEI